MQVTSTVTSTSPVTGSSQFGQQIQAGGDLFSMLMTLLSQSGITIPTTPAGLAPGQAKGGQNVPTGLLGQPVTLPKLPVSNILDVTTAADPQNPAVAASGADLIALLQSLPGQHGTQLSPELTSLLEGDNIDLQTLQQRLAALDDQTRQAVLGEMAALLIQPAIITHLNVPAATSADDTAAIDTDKQSGNKPQLPNLPPPAQPDAAAAAETAPVTKPGQDAPKPEQGAKHNIAASLTPTDTAEQRAAAQALVRNALEKARNADADADTNAAASIKPVASSQPSSPDTPAANIAAAQANAAPAQQNTGTTNNISQPSGSDNKPAPAIKPVQAGSDAGDMADSVLKDLASNNLPQQAAQAVDKAANTFASHLEAAKLNRTGAHIPVTDQISVQMNKAVSEGRDRFTVKLSPAELGRIEIKIDMASDGRVTASFHVDQPATFDLLQRDQRGLERMLSDAGLKTDSGSINFNLRGDGQNGQQQAGAQAQNNSGHGGGQNGFTPDGEAAADDTSAAGLMEMTWYVGPDRLDVHV